MGCDRTVFTTPLTGGDDGLILQYRLTETGGMDSDRTVLLLLRQEYMRDCITVHCN
jgi:hypothetical protein